MSRVLMLLASIELMYQKTAFTGSFVLLYELHLEVQARTFCVTPLTMAVDIQQWENPYCCCDSILRCDFKVKMIINPTTRTGGLSVLEIARYCDPTLAAPSFRLLFQLQNGF